MPRMNAPCPLLWPNRPESRGRLMSLAIRRSEDEVLLVGFRSVPHWQVRQGCPRPG